MPMDSLPVGWSVFSQDQEGDGAELLNGATAATAAGGTNAHIHDLFHEDAQVRRNTILNSKQLQSNLKIIAYFDW